MISEGSRVSDGAFSNSITNCRTRSFTRKRGNRCASLLLLRLFLSLCFISGARSYVFRSIKELKHAVNALRPQTHSPSTGHCDFEDSCDWLWNRTGGFIKTNASLTSRRPFGPFEDSAGSKTGHFLWLAGPASDKIWSKTISESGARCRLELVMHHVQMSNGTIQLIIETNNETSTLAEERFGNNDAKWFSMGFNLGVITQKYRVVLEIIAPYSNSSIAIDNIRLVDCFPEAPPDFNKNCSPDMFCCNNGSSLNKTRVCDLTPDCAEGEDEMAECDKMPENARCNFERGWCGWTNVPGTPWNWTLHQGATPSDGTGPSYDHTYRNSTGTYASIELPRSMEYGSRATIDSPIFNPTPPYSSDPKSAFFKSCQVRFFYHQYGKQSNSLALYLVQVKPHQNDTERLWWKYGNSGNVWYNQAISLPDVRHRYYFQFEARKSYTAKADIAIDDFSLSPECFGIGVPPDVVKDFNYYSPVIGAGRPSEQHVDFVNETVVKITTCGATGRLGPTTESCAREYNKTNSELQSGLPQPTSDDASPIVKLRGVQHWTAPRGGYYTLIAQGARGGRGSLGMGSTLGALVRGVIELQKGETLYFLVGQPGMDACPKILGSLRNDCQQQSNKTSYSSGNSRMTSIFHEVKRIEWTDGGGGGGGATYVFTVSKSGEHRVVLVAAGGGGLGAGRFNDDGTQHGQGPLVGRRYDEGGTRRQDAGGGGGGWFNSSMSSAPGNGSAGLALLEGGLGGQACGKNPQGQGDGGFGGGGGGCKTGGGGGGFYGGRTGHGLSGNGGGGYSYFSSDLLHTSFRTGVNQGPGEVSIIPDKSGCSCDFRCVALDLHLSEIACLCPVGWQLSNNTRSCIVAHESNVAHRTFMILLAVGSIILLFALSSLCVLLYNRYQNRKTVLRRRHFMFDATELTQLRYVTESVLTEFNPNYEMVGSVCRIKDLPQIPRDSISFVKPLGQGAFGEVFQGIYKYRSDEERPVAVKTLPPAATKQAIEDFMMEALIMSKFSHPNIVLLVGISFDKQPRYIILELLAGGDLKNFLREERPRPERPTSLTMLDLVMCAHNVANGCKYMEMNRFIHRDIAARNCLLTCKGPDRVVKIADFGMARDIYRSDYYKKGGKAMLPVKWMPPESFLDGIFSTKSDVWAFGVLLWEIMSFGYMPYTGCANREVMSMVKTGGRLERPAGCPDPIYGLMTRCWHPNPDDRPSFATILERIGYCLQDPDVINYPMPNYDILPPSERDQIIMRPDPETECINVHPDLDGFGYMQPRTVFWSSGYRMNTVPGVVYASLRHGADHEGENIQETTLMEPKQHEDESENTIEAQASINNSPHIGRSEGNRNDEASTEDDNSKKKKAEELLDIEGNNVDSRNANSRESCADRRDRNRNGNGESTTTTDTNSDSLAIPSSTSPPETVVSSPNTRTSSPSHVIINNANGNNINGMIRKSALKAALSLDPSTLYRGTIPYEKIAFSTPPPRLSNPGSMELRKRLNEFWHRKLPPVLSQDKV